ncbi:MAG: LON peptidase substrate-binding domain-containing protein, partial [[Eubacterium] sulci]|nr:LON peptidase substrate-binding domain-containing protein [[Eubacterium] sulci]
MEDKKNTAAETFAENIDTYGNDNDVIMDLEEDEVEKVYPCIPLRGVSIFPNTVIHFDIGREKSIRALEKAMAGDRMMFVSSQKDDN